MSLFTNFKKYLGEIRRISESDLNPLQQQIAIWRARHLLDENDQMIPPPADLPREADSHTKGDK